MKRDTPDILKQIVAVKRREVERLKVETPIPDLEARIEMRNPPLNFGGALMGASVRIIAEVKKASPAKGLLRADFDPVDLASAYIENGAAAISVLTNADHFQGSIDHLAAVHSVSNPKGVPVLRKEFIFDPYQVHEARAYGADAILLIVAMLTPQDLADLAGVAQGYWMQCLGRRGRDRGRQQPGPAHLRDEPRRDRKACAPGAPREGGRRRERHQQP